MGELKPKSQVMIRAGHKAFAKRIHSLFSALSDLDHTNIKDLVHEITTREFQWENQMDKQSLICRYISQTTWKSFTSYGDRNHASPGFMLHWIRTNGEPLDTQAMTMATETGMDVNPDEFAAFMQDNPFGPQSFPYHQQTNQLRSIFKEVLGINYSHTIAKILKPKNSPNIDFDISSVADWWNFPPK